MWLLRRRHIVGGGVTVQGEATHAAVRALAQAVTEAQETIGHHMSEQTAKNPNRARGKLDILGWELGRGTIPQSRILRLKLNNDFLSCVCHIMWSWSAMLALSLCDSDLAASVEESCRGSPFGRKVLR